MRATDFDRVLGCGADKVSVNTGALRTPDLIGEAAKRFGNQCVVLSMDIARVNGAYHVFAKGGREDTGREALAWAREGQERGAGELVLNSIDTDGVRGGFDIALLSAVAACVSIPIVASGGAGDAQHFVELFRQADVEAGLAASIFHSGEVPISRLKELLASSGIPVRIVR